MSEERGIGDVFSNIGSAVKHALTNVGDLPPQFVDYLENLFEVRGLIRALNVILSRLKDIDAKNVELYADMQAELKARK